MEGLKKKKKMCSFSSHNFEGHFVCRFIESISFPIFPFYSPNTNPERRSVLMDVMQYVIDHAAEITEISIKVD